MQGFGNVGRSLARLRRVRSRRHRRLRLERRPSLAGRPRRPGRARLEGRARNAQGLPVADAIADEELLLLECDVLAPCALEQVVSANNAAQVKARIVYKGAKGPVTPAADENLEDHSVLAPPRHARERGRDRRLLLEWVQGLQEYFWKEDEVDKRLDDIVTRAFEETIGDTEAARPSMRIAAYGLAVRRVAKATVTRGLYP